MTFCERLNSEGKQFHQFQENENPPVTSTYWTQKRPRHYIYDVRNPVPGMEQAQQCGGVKPVNRMPCL
jgi:hypothetical protein